MWIAQDFGKDIKISLSPPPELILLIQKIAEIYGIALLPYRRVLDWKVLDFLLP